MWELEDAAEKQQQQQEKEQEQQGQQQQSTGMHETLNRGGWAPPSLGFG